MAPKEPFKVYSLSKHIENTNKGLSADAQYNRRPLGRPAPVVKKEAGAVKKAIFGDDDDSSDDSSGSESSGDEGGAEFLRKLSQPAAKPAAASNASKRPGEDVEIADSDAERNEKPGIIKPEPDSSDDFTSDSDSDEKQKPKANANGAVVKKASSSDSTSDSDSDDENQPAVVKKSESTSDSETSDNDSDSDSDSDSEESESESEADKSKPAAKPAVNGNAAESSSSSENSSSEVSDSEGAKVGKPAFKQAGPSSSSSSTSPSESDPGMVDESIHMEDRQPEDQITPPSAIAPDFVLRKSGDGTSGEDVARICSQANMQGKQFWYFTVPSGVPISVVQNLEIPMDASQCGDRAFTHGGEDFGISFNSMVPKSSIQIMIPSTDGTQYQAASQQIDRVMQVRRITKLGADGSTVGPSEKNGPRPQPEGLKARFKPIGVDSPMGKIGMDSGSGGEDCEMADAAAVPSAPKAQPDKSSSQAQPATSTPKSKKGKRKEAAAEAIQQATGPRSDKRKQPSSEDESAAAASQLMEETHSAETKTKKPKTDRAGSPDLGSEPPLSVAASVKQTPVMPPTIPGLAHSLSGLGSTPLVAASTPLTGKAKKAKKAKDEQPAPSSSQSLPAAKKDTPVPIPRQTAVTIPPISGSSQQPKVSPVPIPLPVAAASAIKDVKKAKKSKENAGKAAGIASSQQTTPPPSAQAPGKKKQQTAEPKVPA